MVGRGGDPEGKLLEGKSLRERLKGLKHGEREGILMTRIQRKLGMRRKVCIWGGGCRYRDGEE